MGDLREEPSAGKPLARICEGESRMAELLDQYPTSAVIEAIAPDSSNACDTLVTTYIQTAYMSAIWNHTICAAIGMEVASLVVEREPKAESREAETTEPLSGQLSAAEGQEIALSVTGRSLPDQLGGFRCPCSRAWGIGRSGGSGVRSARCAIKWRSLSGLGACSSKGRAGSVRWWVMRSCVVPRAQPPRRPRRALRE